MAWRAIQAALPKDAIISSDIGNNCAIGNAYPSFEAGRKYLAPGLFGPCGYGFPAIIGAKIGRPEVPVVGFAGDGAFGIAVNELTACGREGWPAVTMVVFRNYQWGAEKRNSTLWFDDNFVGTELDLDVDFAAVARACGLKGVRATTMEELTRVLAEAVEAQMQRGGDDADRGDPEPGAGGAVPAGRDEEAGAGGGDPAGGHAAPGGMTDRHCPTPIRLGTCRPPRDAAGPREGLHRRKAGLPTQFQPPLRRFGIVRGPAVVDHDLTFVCVESGPSGDVGVDPRLPSGSILAGQRRRLPEQEQSSGGEYPAQLPHDRELLVRIHVVQGLTDPDHVDRVLPVRERDPVVALYKSDRTVESGQLDLGQVEQGARQVDADIAADPGAAQRADRRHGVAAADVNELERPRRVLDQRAMERRVDVAMEDVAEVADFPVRLPALQEIALVPCLQPLRPVNHGAPPPRHVIIPRPPASCHRTRDAVEAQTRPRRDEEPVWVAEIRREGMQEQEV